MAAPRTVYLMSQLPGQSFQCGSGNVYTTDKFGFIQPTVDSLPKGDAVELLNMGCVPFTPLHIGHLIAADFNVTYEQEFPVAVPPGILFRVTRVTVVNATAPLDTAVGGMYIGDPEGGGIIVPPDQSYAAVTAHNIALDLQLHSPESSWTWGENDTPHFCFKLETPQGSDAYADVYVFGDIFWPQGSPGQGGGGNGGSGFRSIKLENDTGNMDWGD